MEKRRDGDLRCELRATENKGGGKIKKGQGVWGRESERKGGEGEKGKRQGERRGTREGERERKRKKERAKEKRSNCGIERQIFKKTKQKKTQKKNKLKVTKQKNRREETQKKNNLIHSLFSYINAYNRSEENFIFHVTVGARSFRHEGILGQNVEFCIRKICTHIQYRDLKNDKKRLCV